MSSGIVELLYDLDRIFTKDMQKVERRLPCKECKKLASQNQAVEGVSWEDQSLLGRAGLAEGGDGVSGAVGADSSYFELDEEFQLKKLSICSEKLHTPNEDLKRLLKTSTGKKKPFSLGNLMSKNKKSLGLEEWKGSKIQSEILAGKFEQGRQIWIYHDAETEPWSRVGGFKDLIVFFMARFNKYAHCIIYVGEEQEEETSVHKIVHIESYGFVGWLRSTIEKRNIDDVIEDYNLVFDGHRIEDSQVSANSQKKIAERAIECADADPQIIFEYSHWENCETFYNHIMFDIPDSQQRKTANFVIGGIFKAIGWIKGPFKCKCMAEQIRAILPVPSSRRQEPDDDQAQVQPNTFNFKPLVILFFILSVMAGVLLDRFFLLTQQ